MAYDIDDLSLAQRVVLLGVAHLDADDQTPAPVNEITRVCAEYADAVEAATLGRVTEAEVDRALNALEAEGLVSVPEMDDTSPVGKGRPAYELAADVDGVLEALEGDDRLGDLAAEVGD